MPRVLLYLVVVSGCETLDGQKVTVLLRDRELTCEPAEGRSVARLTLDHPDDLYVAELAPVGEPERAFTVAAERDGRDVVFTCVEGVSSITVRHATVLQDRVDDQLTF
jgi:hypothetical protein